MSSNVVPLIAPRVAMTASGFRQGQAITCDRTHNTYTIGNCLGEGHFGVVFECTDQWDNPLIAKVLKPESHVGSDEARMCASAEFAKLQMLRHPLITYVYDAFEFNGYCVIVTERCTMPLSELFFDGYDPEVWFIPIARCLLQAVDFIHFNGMAHKDLHLANIFLNFHKNELNASNSNSLNFKVGDLGIANFVGDIRPGNTMLAKWMLPPEVLDAGEFGPLDSRIDIYHCGLMFLELWHGRRFVFTSDEILQGVPRQMALELPPPYSHPVEKALRRHVHFRTSSAKELWRDLRSPAGT